MSWSDGIHNPAAMKAVLGVQLMSGLGYGLVFPVAALYGEQAGLSPAVITALIALHPVMRLVSGPLWGRLADRVGRRPVLIAGLGLQITGHLIFALVGGPFGLGLGRLLTGLGSGEAVAAWAAVADLTVPERRAAGLGMIRAANGVGMLMGPILGGLLGLGGLGWPGLGAAVACIVSLWSVLRSFPETRSAEPHEALMPEETWPVPRRALLIAAMAAAAITLAESIVPLAIEHVLVPTLTVPHGWSAADVALLLTVGVILAWGLTTAIFDGFLSAKLVERLGEKRSLVLGLGGWAVAFALTPLVYTRGILPGGLAVALTAIPVSLAGVGLATWLSRQAGPRAQGRVIGRTQAAMALGEALGPAISGALYSLYYGTPYLVGASLLLIALPIALSLAPLKGRKDEAD